jgi:hypothetical protein
MLSIITPIPLVVDAAVVDVERVADAAHRVILCERSIVGEPLTDPTRLSSSAHP